MRRKLALSLIRWRVYGPIPKGPIMNISAKVKEAKVKTLTWMVLLETIIEEATVIK